ncbi:MAG: aldolase [Candidatus Methanospirare jalkutatii]|nr:aldolase [Candidatus Methanospirare jalkutatii]
MERRGGQGRGEAEVNESELEEIFERVARIGKKAVSEGLVNANFGNLSVRVGSKMLISRSGAFLDELHKGNLVEVRIEEEGNEAGGSGEESGASSEAIVHREIYKNTEANAILHTHSPFVVSISLLLGDVGEGAVVKPVDVEGTLLLGEIPVVGGAPGSIELASNLASALKSHRAAIAHAHGCFAVGSTIEEAFVVASAVEHACKVKFLCEISRNAIHQNK